MEGGRSGREDGAPPPPVCGAQRQRLPADDASHKTRQAGPKTIKTRRGHRGYQPPQALLPHHRHGRTGGQVTHARTPRRDDGRCAPRWQARTKSSQRRVASPHQKSTTDQQPYKSTEELAKRHTISSRATSGSALLIGSTIQAHRCDDAWSRCSTFGCSLEKPWNTVSSRSRSIKCTQSFSAGCVCWTREATQRASNIPPHGRACGGCTHCAHFLPTFAHFCPLLPTFGCSAVLGMTWAVSSFGRLGLHPCGRRLFQPKTEPSMTLSVTMSQGWRAERLSWICSLVVHLPAILRPMLLASKDE